MLINIINFNFTSISPAILTAAGLCIFLAVIGKSAQFPLFNWLPDAMEGPTPVSALIHAATMVAAGVYLVARSYLLFFASPDHQALVIVAYIGGLTALMAATIGISEHARRSPAKPALIEAESQRSR